MKCQIAQNQLLFGIWKFVLDVTWNSLSRREKKKKFKEMLEFEKKVWKLYKGLHAWLLESVPWIF